MLNFLIDLPVWMGIAIVSSFICALGILTVTQTKRLVKNYITKQHEKVGRLLFRITAGLIALLISLSYANERMNQIKIIDSMEEETSLIVSMLMGLNNFQSPESDRVVDELDNYVRQTIDDDWSNINTNPFFSEANNSLVRANELLFKLPAKNDSEQFQKNTLISNLNEVTKLMQIRIYSKQTIVPYLIHILAFGLVFMWVFFTVYKLDLISLSFLSLYNILIGILIYFVFMLSNPLIGPMKIEPHSFVVLKTKGLDIKDR